MNQTELVNTITLEELFIKTGIKKVDLIKMDIESYEYEAIIGSNVFKKKMVQAMILDLHSKFLEKRGLNPDKIIDFLLNCGYKIDKRFSDPLLFVAN